MPTNPLIRKASVPQTATKTSQKASEAWGIHPIWVLTVLFLFIMICFSYRIMAAGGLNLFVWGDHVLGVGSGNPPIVMWALAGLFLGAVTGSLVIWRKYHIKFQWCLLTIIPFLSVLSLLQVLSDPLQPIVPRPLAVAADSNQMKVVNSAPVIVKRKRYKTVKPARSPATATKSVVAPAECAEQLADVSINARTDSVNIYYRMATYQHGPWGQWRSKFIPQQGQFSLTEEGQVRANSLQYYYETKSVFTRSAQNPYTRQLCEEPLVMETY
jgi:hypothetical protein